jgi:hypothetical protein
LKPLQLLSDGLTELGGSGESEQSCNEPDDVPLLPPRIGVAHADPAFARQVRAEEAAAERARQEARRGEAELSIQLHGWGMTRLLELRRLGVRRATTPIGQTLNVEANGTLRRVRHGAESLVRTA